tara:strand:- start:212 stop:478 length:267 start_codon:yes stop_codon:yes gene_type:complete
MKERSLTEQSKKLIGEPHFRNRVSYYYNHSRHAYIFCVPLGDGSREMLPIAQFQPIISDEMPYDATDLIEHIADWMSQDIERNDKPNQ